MKFIAIENLPKNAVKLDEIGVERIMIDLEKIGKQDRQGHLDSVKSFTHKLSDIEKVKKVLINSDLLVRSNAIYKNSKTEIDSIIKNGADIIMLPYFKTLNEVKFFLDCVNGRAKVILLVETINATKIIDEIIKLNGIDEIHIGLNDLHLEMNLNFMFELLSNGIVDNVCKKIKTSNIPYGIGGISSLNSGLISGNLVLNEYLRLGSSSTILSRSFFKSCNSDWNIAELELNKIKNHIKKFKTNSSYLLDSSLKFNNKINIIKNSK